MPKTSLSSSKHYAPVAESIRGDGRLKFGPGGYSRIIFTNGCFDVLHRGHLSILETCRKLAGPKGAVVVGINSDESVRRLKGNDRPVQDAITRGSVLISMKNVTYVCVFEEDTPEKLVSALRPDMIVKGADYKTKKVVGSEICPVTYVDIVEGISTTKTIERMRNVT